MSEVRIANVQCGICEKTWGVDTAASIAKKIARHWNMDHADELKYSMEPYKTEQWGGEHIHGDRYSYRVVEFYVTAYDVLDSSGPTCGPFAYRFVKQPESQDVCEDCWRSIHAVDGYQELETGGYQTEYLCDECAHDRRVKRRRDENEQLSEWCA